MHLFIRCWALPHASAHHPHFSDGNAEAQRGGLGTRLRSWATGQVLVSALISMAAQVPWSQSTAFSGLESSHQAPESHCLRHVGAPTQQPLGGGREGGRCGAGTVDLPERSARGGEQKSECLGLGPQQPPSPESSRWAVCSEAWPGAGRQEARPTPHSMRSWGQGSSCKAGTWDQRLVHPPGREEGAHRPGLGSEHDEKPAWRKDG